METLTQEVTSMPFWGKCGEITFSFGYPDIKIKDVTLHCIFCDQTWEQLEEFVDHLKIAHLGLIESFYKYENKYGAEDTIDELSSAGMQSIEEQSENTTSSWNEQYTNHFEDHNEHDADFDLSIHEYNITELTEENIKTEENYENLGSEVNLEASQNESKTNSSKSNPFIRSHFTSDVIRENVILNLIRELRKYPPLWPIRYDYDKRSECEDFLNKITLKLQSNFPTEMFNKEYLRRKISKLKCLFSKAESGEISFSSVPYYQYLTFLRGSISKKQTPEKVNIDKNSSGSYSCPICFKKFSVQANVVKHLRIHREEYSCRCEICDKPFYFPNQLRRHMLIHTQEKPFICEMCGKDFRLHGELTRHIKIHLKQRDFKCGLCPKAFYRNKALQEHMNTHAKVRPETCEICAKSFYSKRQLYQHMDIHSDVKKYECSICGKAFAQRAGRSSHMRIGHGIGKRHDSIQSEQQS